MKVLYFRVRFWCQETLEVLQRMMALANIAKQNNMSKELIDVLKYYKNEDVPNAHHCLMFVLFYKDYQQVSTSYENDKITMTFKKWS